MEQTSLPTPQPGPGQCGSDREVFERVWRRVMPADRPDCPFTLFGDGEAAPSEAPPALRQNDPPETPPTPCRENPAEEPSRRVPRSTAMEEDVPCLGAASAVYGPLLQEFITHERADGQTYRLLARRAGGGAGRVLAAIAADESRHAKRLGAAYFLISGVRFAPEAGPALPPECTYLSALRDRFLSEQRGAERYRTAANRTDDPCLKELFLELGSDEEAHARLILGLLEQM